MTRPCGYALESTVVPSAPVIAALVFCAARLFAAEPPIAAIAFSPGGKELVVGSQGGLDVLAWPDLGRKRRLDAELVNVHDVAFSHDGKWLAAVGGVPAEEGAIEVYAWPDGTRRFRNNFHDDLIYSIAWRKDDAVLATASLDRTCSILNARSGDPVHLLKGHSRGVTAVSWLADGQTLVTAGIDQSVRVWSASSGAAVRVLDNHTEPIHDMALRPQAGGGELPMLVTVSSDRTVRLWQPTIGRLVRFARLDAVPLSVVWSGDGSVIVVGCRDGHVRVVDPDSVQVLHDLPALDGWAYSLAVHPEGAELVVGGKEGQLKRLVAPPALRRR